MFTYIDLHTKFLLDKGTREVVCLTCQETRLCTLVQTRAMTREMENDDAQGYARLTEEVGKQNPSRCKLDPPGVFERCSRSLKSDAECVEGDNLLDHQVLVVYNLEQTGL